MIAKGREKLPLFDQPRDVAYHRPRLTPPSTLDPSPPRRAETSTPEAAAMLLLLVIVIYGCLWLAIENAPEADYPD